MSKKAKAKRNRYSEEFKQEALDLAGKVGVAAARELGLRDSQLYAWRSKATGQRKVSEREHELMMEKREIEARAGAL